MIDIHSERLQLLTNRIRRRILDHLIEVKELGILIPFLMLFFAVGIARPVFFSQANLINVARDVSYLLILALGITAVMSTGGIDISVGQVSSLAGITAGLLLVNGGPVPLAIIIGLATGLVCGFINGFLVARIGIPSIIATLGMMFAAQGVGLIITSGNPLYPFPPQYVFIGQGSVLGIPISVWLALVLSAIFFVLLHRTRYGYWLAAVGGNRETARRAGLNVPRLEWSTYLLSGFCAALMGILFSARLATAKPSLGVGLEMKAIIATIIGGTSLYGGVVTVLGTLIGATIMGMLNDVLVILKIASYWQDLVIGVLLVITVGFDTYRRRIRFIPERTKRLIQREAAVERPDLALILKGAGTSLESLSTPISRNGEPVLQLKGITKYFGYVQALSEVDLQIYPNEVLALVGDNGAGKSTLVKVASGSLQPEEGEIFLLGEKIKFNGPGQAAEMGIAMLYQDLALVDCRDVAANLFLGREPTQGRWLIDRSRMLEGTQMMLAGLKMKIPSAKTPVQYLSGGQRQGVAIGRAVSQGASIIILDEPTAALGVEESGRVLALMEELKAAGCSIVVISHNLHHVFSVADRITVLRSGQCMGTWLKDQTTPEEIVAAITGATILETI